MHVRACATLLVALSALGPRVCCAEEFAAKDILEDAKLYFTEPVRWDRSDWLTFGGVLVTIAAAHQFDGEVRDHFETGSRAVPNGTDPNSLRDAIPAAAMLAGTWAFATLSDDSAGRVESYTMLEAASFSSITTLALRFAAGRERPSQTPQVNDWRAGGTSFPSLHASAAFAIGTVLAESGGDDFRWIRRILGYGAASATVYLRLHDNAHWLSDTVAGSAIGISTAVFSMNRREYRARRWDISVAPLQGGGVGLAFNLMIP